ncbi:hypothetical protein V8G54_016812 [Vigna mungo]|uniref:Dolichyl-diphosphooligosaccharide--protein glycosyltransferase subunit DAD1 n=1 Tax=Vigna mungo TaxID=3915 RepID=A0AAQ3NN85_VIGMU
MGRAETAGRIDKNDAIQLRHLDDFRVVCVEVWSLEKRRGILLCIAKSRRSERMARSGSKDAQDLFRALWSAYAATPTNLKIIDLYVMFAVFTALIQVVYIALVGSFPFNSFLSGVLSCVGTAVLADICAQYGTYIPATNICINLVVFFLIIVFPLHCGPVCLRIQVNKENKEFKDLAPERAFADFVLCNLVLHLVIMNFLG